MHSNIATTILLVLLWMYPMVPAYPTDAGDAVDIFSVWELAALYKQSTVPAEFQGRLNRLLTVPFVDNRLGEGPAKISKTAALGEFIRIAHWNIERGIEYEALEVLFGGEDHLSEMLDTVRFPVGSRARLDILEQARALREADVIVLNEVDWGLNRSGYRNIAADLAARLGMNYAFGVEFLELSPVYLSGKTITSAARSDAVSELSTIDADRYRGLHGIAILSRFPLENVRLVPFKNQPYDWFEAEKRGVSLVEKAKRTLVKQVFLAEALREVRRGGRTMLMADIVNPGFPAGRATVVGTHLEIRTSPANRQVQLKELLETIKPIRNPVIVAGDMNTSTTDMTPTSLQRELSKRFGKPEYLLKSGVNYFLGIGMLQDAAVASLTFGRNHGDPTVRHIPILMPNEERKFFSVLKEFRFADGGSFDFRGEPLRSANGKRNTLANSNERNKKGFVTTFRLERPVKFLGRFKLDWIFVKPVHLFDPSDYQGSYLFAPHYGRTLRAVNSIAEKRISDHSPMIVDLPLAEPAIEKQKKRK